MAARKTTKKSTKKAAPKGSKKTATRTGNKKAARKGSKTAAAKSSPVGAVRPKFKANAAANRAVTERKSLFMSLPVGTTTMRIIPRYDPEGLEKGLLFVPQKLHYDIKGGFVDIFNPDTKRRIAPACLQEHGDGNCYMCHVIDWLKAGDDQRLAAIAKEDLYPSEQLQCQAWILDPSSKTWYGPRIVKVPKGVAGELSDKITVAEDNDMVPWSDPDEGQRVAVTRTGTGQFGTTYTVDLVGRPESIESIASGWWEQCFKDLPTKLDVKVLNIDQQKELLVTAHPEWPWDKIEADIG